jgi:SAM-dependent methyltransferase
MKPPSDYFSGQADSYANYRPAYPAQLYHLILPHVPARELAWDCATGNGQCALALSRYFARVLATDISANQLAKRMEAPNVQYQRAAAEQTAFADGIFDLVTVAQALHWFDTDAFYREVRRVAKPGGVLAVWGYGDLFTNSPMDAVINRLNHAILGAYWPPERTLVDTGYQTIPFPFPVLTAATLTMQKAYTLHELLGYFRSWSSAQRYQQQHGHDPVALIREELALHWRNPEARHTVNWPVFLKVGRVEKDH